MSGRVFFLFPGWPVRGFPATQRETRGSPALCVSGNFQGKQRVFGAPFWKLASFPESESWSGAKSEAKLRKSTKYPGGRRVNSRYARVLRKIPGILTIWPKIWLILGPNQPQTRLRAKNLTISTEFSRENREEKRGCCREKRKGKETGCERERRGLNEIRKLQRERTLPSSEHNALSLFSK